MTATIPKFNAAKLRVRLARLARNRQLAFGASCCERLIPNYEIFQQRTGWGDISAIRDALRLVWASAGGLSVLEQGIRRARERCEVAIPDLDDFNDPFVSFAQDAGCTIMNLLDFLGGSNVDSIVWAAEHATESVYGYVPELEDMAHAVTAHQLKVQRAADLYGKGLKDLSFKDDDFESRIWTHPLMQCELRQQESDLELIEEAELIDRSFLAKLRANWNNKGTSNLDVP